jgi:hypothetical protein
VKNRVATASAWGLSLLASLLISGVDNLAYGGEVSPIVIVALILAASFALAYFRDRPWTTAIAVWICIPLTHFAKHIASLADTLQPNTYRSIALLAGFTLVVSLAGSGVGTALRHWTSGSSHPSRSTQ